MNYTKEQLSFIEERGHNILVSAAAGSGKTAVIVERVIRLITVEKYSVSELLVVTFTKAAAAEMRDRIRDAIAEALLDQNITEEIREHLLKQMTLIYSADITTIDSFCLNLVREHFNICHVDPSFRVADEGELRLIAEEVMDGLLEERYESGDERFYRFADDISTGRSDEAVAAAVRSVYGFAVARPDPGKYISSMAEQYRVSSEEELEQTAFLHSLMEIAAGRISLAISILEHAGSICDRPGGPYYYREIIDGDIEEIRTLADCGSYRECQERLNEISFRTLSSKKDESVDVELRERAKKLRDRAKKIVREELAGKLFASKTDDIIYELGMCLPDVEELSSLTLEYLERYSEAKRERGVVDFSDLEHMALAILQDDETRQTMKDRYRELIIDEYQDCNRVQEEIFTAISNGHNYVTVGDVKQSIYSFRDACPELFMDKYERYLAGDDGSSKLITLSKNFRCSMDVTGMVNHVFSRIMSRECGGAVYDDSQSLHYGELYGSDASESGTWRTEYINIEGDPDGSEDDITCEARGIARRIHELTGDVEGIPALEIENRKDNSVRKCGYGDIVILIRSVQGMSDTFAEVFAKEGIPLVFDSRSGYLLSYEIREIMNLLSVIDNPRQDIPLAGVMMGCFGSFDASEMVFVRSHASEGDLYDSLKEAAADEGNKELAAKCKAFINMLEGYRERSAYTPIHELVDRIILDHRYDDLVMSMPDGARRLGNLRLLKKRAADYEKTSFHGLFKFLRYIENMKKYEMDFGEAGSGGQSDAVRIMSIHHSKGLEFPVVFVSTLKHGMNMTDSRAAFLFDDELGVGMDLIIRDRNLRIRTLIKKVMSKKKVLATVSEEMRVLYVAMTRAENKLILTSMKDDGKTPKTEPEEAGALADFINMSIRDEDKENACFDMVSMQYKPAEYNGSAGAGGAVTEDGTGQASPNLSELKEKADAAEASKIIKSINYVYPYEKSLNVPQKVSVSYIKHEAMEEKGVSIASDPRGDRVVPTAGALRGTAVHTAFENLPLGMPPDDEHIRGYLDRLVAEGRLSETERGYIKESDIKDFLASDICARMKSADERHELFREQPFIISVPASQIDSSYPEEDRVMVQGIIDAFFTEDGQVVVVDYKTDSVSSEQILKDRYQAQLEYYERALRQLMDIVRSEKIIYSVSLGREIKLADSMPDGGGDG